MSSEPKTTFDRVAEIYDETRPGYSEQMIEDAISFSGIPPRGRILEIACGPGKATLPFARRGYRMVCVELGANLARLAAQHCSPYPNVEIQNMAFEDWPLQPESFDLVLCAEALHWIAPEVRLSKPAAALKAGGAIALFWHDHLGDPSLAPAADAVIQHHAPQLLASKSRSAEQWETETIAEIDGSGLFRPVTLRHYSWQIEYTAEQYVKLISTYSSVQSLAEDVRQTLLTDIYALIEQRGGRVASEYVTRLYLGKKK